MFMPLIIMLVRDTDPDPMGNVLAIVAIIAFVIWLGNRPHHR